MTADGASKLVINEEMAEVKTLSDSNKNEAVKEMVHWST